ncbi:hypothetical protein QCA50_008232 [Cerrena zonata]|uniref:Uncharacterized protein n=1 Tax=Cerrena zonata TaxID=2478898 RepID=A0AAW0GAP0_9APHY
MSDPLLPVRRWFDVYQESFAGGSSTLSSSDKDEIYKWIYVERPASPPMNNSLTARRERTYGRITSYALPSPAIRQKDASHSPLSLRIFHLSPISRLGVFYSSYYVR